LAVEKLRSTAVASVRKAVGAARIVLLLGRLGQDLDGDRHGQLTGRNGADVDLDTSVCQSSITGPHDPSCVSVRELGEVSGARRDLFRGRLLPWNE
jgi:hypothetical protein